MIAAIAILAILASEALSVYALAELFTAGFGDGKEGAPDAALLVAVALGAYFIPQGVAWLRFEGRRAAAVAAAAAFVVIYGAMRIAFASDVAIWDFGWAIDFLRDSKKSAENGGAPMLGSLFILVTWVIASRRANEEVEFDLIPRQVGIPFALVTIALILSVYTDRGGEVARGGAAFYTVAVIALACSQLARSGATFGDVRAGGTTAVLLGATLGLTVASVLVFGVLFAFAGPHIGPPLGNAIEKVAYVVLYPPAWLLEKLFSALFGGAGVLDQLENVRQSPVATEQGSVAPKEPSAAERAGEYGLRTIGLIILFAIVAGAAAWYVRVRRKTGVLRSDGATVSAAGAFGEDLRGLLRNPFHRGHRGDASPHSRAQQLYLEVLAGAGRRGQERTPGQTPDEFAPALEGVFQTALTNDITAAFDQARYAGREPDERTLADLESRWRALKG